MFKVRALSRLHGESIPEGHQNRGCVFYVSRDVAFELAKNRSVEILEGDDTGPTFETKEGDGPSSSETKNAPSSSLPAANPPAASTSPPSTVGPSSPSATATASGPASSAATRRTGAGGTTTTKGSKARTAKPTDGARTAKRAGTLTSDGSNPSTAPASLANAAASTPED